MQPVNGGRYPQMSGHGEKFSRLKEQAIVALLTYPTISEAAAAVRVNERTVERWLKLPAFSKRFEDAKARILHATINKLLNGGEQAANVLVKLATSDTTPAAVKVRAAVAVIQLSLKWHSLSNIERQLRDLQATISRIPERRLM